MITLITLTDALDAHKLVQAYLDQQMSQSPSPSSALITQGHQVTEDPPLSVTTRGTVFGLNYDGSNDIGDLDPNQPDGNSRGFFIDPATNQPYVTHSQDLMGCSIPREVLLSTFMGVDAWQTQGIDKVWREYASDLLKWVSAKKPTLDIDSGGKYTILSVPLVDAGPEGTTHNGLDLTYKAAHALATFGAATCTYWILLSGKVQTIAGWDWSKNRVIGS